MASPKFYERPIDIVTPNVLLTAFLTLSTVWVGYHVLKTIYNVSPLHPLYHIPGPRLAAASYFKEFYHDVILHGRYTHQIRAMHERYGMK